MNLVQKLLFPGLQAKLAIAKLRLEFSQLEGRLEALEQRQGDLADRFSRFQNREGMRRAREATEVDQTMLDEAQAILARSGEPEGIVPATVAPPGALDPKKAELWRKRRLS